MISALCAAGPDPRWVEELMLYGRLVGTWTIDGRNWDESGHESALRGEWRFGWVLGGRAVQDVLLTFALGDAGQDTPASIGTTLRMFDPTSGRWHLAWAGPSSGTLCTLIGWGENGNIVQEGRWGNDADTRPWRWTFSDITARRFTWRCHISEDGGRTWRLAQEFLARRMD